MTQKIQSLRSELDKAKKALESSQEVSIVLTQNQKKKKRRQFFFLNNFKQETRVLQEAKDDVEELKQSLADVRSFARTRTRDERERKKRKEKERKGRHAALYKENSALFFFFF